MAITQAKGSRSLCRSPVWAWSRVAVIPQVTHIRRMQIMALQLSRRLIVSALVALSVAGLAAAGGTASTKADKGTVAVFIPSTTNNYIATMVATSRKAFAAAGYKMELYENNFDQTQEDQQVQQYLASGKKPAGIVWFPADNKAGIASARRLKTTGAPIVQTNQAVLPEAKAFITAYAGEDDYTNGRIAGQSAIKMRDAWRKAGKKLHDPNGNIVIITYPGNYQAGIDRIQGFKDATKSRPFNIIKTVPASFTTEDSYKAVKPAWTTVNDDADFIFAVSEFPGLGAMQAAKEAGRKLGVDLGTISGNCQNNFDMFISGAEYATAIQSPAIEAKTFSAVLIKLMQNGGKTQGSGTKLLLAANATTMPAIPNVPTYYTFMPNPPMIGGGTPAQNRKVVNSTKLWGGTPQTLCAK